MFYSLKSIRMCVGCRQRFLQSELLRLSYKNNSFSRFDGSGRSFYFCKACIQNEKNIVKGILGFKSLESKQERLKEIQEIAKQWTK